MFWFQCDPYQELHRATFSPVIHDNRYKLFLVLPEGLAVLVHPQCLGLH